MKNVWHESHRQPQHHRYLLDDVSLLLSYLYKELLPFFARMHKKDKKSRTEDAFVRRYGAPLCLFIKSTHNAARAPRTERGLQEQKRKRGHAFAFQCLHDWNTLDWTKSFDLLHAWLRHMLANKGNCVRKGNYVRNRFEWQGFFLEEDEMHTCCFRAVQAAEEDLRQYRHAVYAPQ